MIGYKAFDENLRCRDYQFEVGKTYKTSSKKCALELCTGTVFHFCRELHKIETVSGYRFRTCRVCEVIAEGDIVTDGDKYGTNILTVLREIPKEELNEYIHYNSGDYNSGNRNSGDYNSGDHNSGNWNSGNYNSGNYNSGNYNSGNCNSGDYNSGNRNSGDYNSGDHNSGNWNSGNCNSGNRNSGNCNSGNRNSGNCNSGNYNSGNWNSGDHNSGNWNSGDHNSGYFNTDTPPVRIFNKETDVPHEEIDFPKFLSFDLTVWVNADNATDEEKEAHKADIKTCGGFTKPLAYKEAFRIAWDEAGVEEHKKLLALPNWNNEIFKDISGIDAEAEIAQEEEARRGGKKK